LCRSDRASRDADLRGRPTYQAYPAHPTYWIVIVPFSPATSGRP